MKWLFVLVLILPGRSIFAEDAYQLLRSDPTGYAEVIPGVPLNFSRDHLPHKDFKIEWWYLTANVKDKAGQDYGIHWTLFRQAMSAEQDPGGWQSNQVWMGHTALSLPDRFIYEQRFARGGIGQAGVSVGDHGKFSAWLDDWAWQAETAEPFPGTLAFTSQDTSVELTMSAETPWVLQGDNGYSQKSELGQASYYYSQPHINIEGSIEVDGMTKAVTGLGWLDREWSSQPLAPDQPGWDWLSLHLDDGYALMLYRLRQEGREDWVSGSWVDPLGSSITLSKDDVVFEPAEWVTINTPRGEKTLPLSWRVSLPGFGKSWTVSAIDSDHWLDTAFPYWEGPMDVKGSSTGKGYLELTGY
jgi:predicted secreted hydrolase